MQPTDILVDVIALSEQLCKCPIEGRLAYATKENFCGKVVDGYHPDASDICLLTREAAKSLCLVQNEVLSRGRSLFIPIINRLLS